jgi:hypothetical protein
MVIPPSSLDGGTRSALAFMLEALSCVPELVMPAHEGSGTERRGEEEGPHPLTLGHHQLISRAGVLLHPRGHHAN